ncbi:hypothetical protein DICPUDRAFT_43673 [Dictyostelium purpureum]|uniref:Uncharacterized protein n=1 Tax=Dictyostelium purpureum TaxID=5786 RepID=F1A4K7_DICPU|nr:uncharacterized protein DICPUDRAFT_43673 [Dictyostelium purpureum]EGC28872.1 hypothetical protein DICPUDRAFT_43673 [Dictyostelium purpureum]|eukprot:XP_003294601.1 hypothetical protein DICPUDRAFT_43673 [Dictyostelium purpureum]
MQIFIREATENKEWYILDLQGHLEYSCELKNETLGTLIKKPNTKDDFTFQIGNQVLNGKEVPLKKPLLVIRKKNINEDLDNDVNMVDSSEISNANNVDESEVEYIIEGMANSKITFTTRPTTIIPQSSVVYGSPTHRVSPTNSPTNTNKTSSSSTTTPTTESPIKQPQFN